jgi:hypothetical protein
MRGQAKPNANASRRPLTTARASEGEGHGKASVCSAAPMFGTEATCTG